MTTITKTFKAAELRGMDMPWGAPEGGEIISDKITGKSRWCDVHTLIVRFPDQPEGDAWSMGYRIGSTESQDERPWEYDDEVVATLVREREVTVKKWMPVDASDAAAGGGGE